MNINDLLIREASKAFKNDEVPVGCIIVSDNKIIAKAHNNKQKKHSCINHAEILAIRKAERKIKDWRLDDCILYVTLEPCNMCKEVIKQARIKKVYYLLPTNFHNEDQKIISYKLMENNNEDKEKYQALLKKYFAMKR